ncbi:class I SAM-dependent methyltransferase [Flexibacterium corallicola]|uniref:class I SAM-dependent methyltransferase n=1 Tax=Flexibacterium corallicola TaxID=3037259 RepID=UPI00286F4AFB|nr:methyltransferase domain-containing protein [Pseudovibrio sp. M1P-2-3]
MKESRHYNGCHTTTNHRGIIFKSLSKASRDFVTFTSHIDKPALDMGCAFGVATLPVLQKHKHIVACDLSKEHLRVLRENTPENLLCYLQTQVGCFPQDFQFKENSIGAIHCSHLLHFLTGDELMAGLEKFKVWLCETGKLFINVGTPSLPFLGHFQEEYLKRKHWVKWPGEMDEKDIKQYVTPEYIEWIGAEAMYSFCHPLDKETLSRALTESGFQIDEIYRYTLEDNGDLRKFKGENAHLSAVAH